MPTAKLVMCDCDGTLVDSEPLGNRALAETFTNCGYSISEAEAIDRFKGLKLADSIAIVEKESGKKMPPSFESTFRARMAEIFEADLQPIQGAKELVESFLIDFCVVSNGPPIKIKHGLSLTGLWPYFESKVYSAYEIGVWKPNPALFLNVAKQYKVNPVDCIVIEDSLPGVQASIAAGMLVCVYNPEDQRFPKSKLVKDFRSLQDMTAHLVEIGVSKSG
ncbi:MAG: HAD-IA family hydrolase [Pseudomonadales bacterium]|nr:HAD-IA family hydrolase [Pseudomonadales bacterium]